MQASRIQCSLGLLRSERCLGRVYYQPKCLESARPSRCNQKQTICRKLKMLALEPTGERLLTGDFNDNTVEHLHRYAFALPFCKGKHVLDMTSGEGYGSNLIAGVVRSVRGLDISKEAVSRARTKYRRTNLKFIEGSVSNVPVDSSAV